MNRAPAEPSPAFLTKYGFLLPSIFLVVVALHQIYLTRTEHLSPWKGGGFGMFSSTELGPARFVRVLVEAPERSEELLIPESLQELEQRAAILPSDSCLKKLAEGILQHEQRKKQPVSVIRIDVWRTEYEVMTLRPHAQKIRDYVFKADQAME